jgi:hypothetical protein
MIVVSMGIYDGWHAQKAEAKSHRGNRTQQLYAHPQRISEANTLSARNLMYVISIL